MFVVLVSTNQDNYIIFFFSVFFWRGGGCGAMGTEICGCIEQSGLIEKNLLYLLGERAKILT